MVCLMIRERRPGVWEVVVYLGRSDGKKQAVSRTVRGSRDDAAIEERRLKLQHHERRLRRYETAAARQTHHLLLRPVGTVVYRIFNHDDELVYVGVTSCIFRRMAAHLARPGLGDAAFRCEWEQFDSRSAALAAERALIREYRPRYNIQGAA